MDRSLTSRDRIELKTFMNAFSDRWPGMYHEFFHRFKNENHFQIACMWRYVKLAKLDNEDNLAILQLIKKLRDECCSPQGRIKFKTQIEEIDCNGKL